MSSKLLLNRMGLMVWKQLLVTWMHQCLDLQQVVVRRVKRKRISFWLKKALPALAKAGLLGDLKLFFKLIADDAFPLSNIAFPPGFTVHN